ncbi:acyl-[acyl-carrier-protein] thioesterase [Desulfosporosinus metallidurans]|uniref:Acyl-acyl carrier protein thioesterase n=1 Tax=Desulfosporosinus metallidurans TaxID=1888891 RepID=A0A1Q8QNK6_9FIRM|nr:acyl-ACP thioesterase domain-containing protein [Desulfosporosinus metallidurans]OLN28872.1 Acyl-acyl carrier protein thioesterase [Desulfosporosinus metallidurans]
MGNQKFRIEFEVHYHEVNPLEEATPLTMLHYLEDAAIAHSEAVGYGVGRLKTEQRAWILNRWNLQIERYPIYGEKVIIETWPSNFERFYATREFIIRNHKQEIIGRATSLWIFINTQTKRPLRIGLEFRDAYGLDAVRAIEDHFNQLHAVKEGEGGSKGEQAFLVRRSDIDTNGHVNNANYLQWMLEVIPEDVYKNNHLASLEIIYKKETTYGSSIRSKCYVKGLEQINPEFGHVILDEMGQELAIAKTVWD